ncbi:hypothetical protein COEREDRAFT_82959 [Coemansia reversa NRRL 1564]|uniref:Uncharacterized protein n=1 Tax=Coemansia reversa (strain ATCC 12441 / NRRL 1564) TaxID=763665 RepID=A0A2G5B550_COERN|nr:hypothetical protein COEREDRAFT_82959 [Coemansia reversa NRRL 1564]|eukprot:PIA14135.1 hypothetical protein COEREDRAFT_82959 [Coemansia reversa NRRL 1564]
MQIFTTLLVAASAVLAQQIGSDQGPNVSNGPSAVSNPNVNNGQQLQNSLVSGGSKGGNVFEDLVGNTFIDSASNVGISDNNFVNPSSTSVSGNTGATTNGQGNSIGDFFGAIPGGIPIGFHKRDAVFNNYGHGQVGYPVGYAPHGAPVHVLPAPVYHHPVYVPVHHVQASYPAVAPRPVGYPVGQVNHNSQNAAIVQNQA